MRNRLHTPRGRTSPHVETLDAGEERIGSWHAAVMTTGSLVAAGQSYVLAENPLGCLSSIIRRREGVMGISSLGRG